MTSKFLAALAVLVIVSVSCICVDLTGELMEMISIVAGAGSEIREIIGDTQPSEDMIDGEPGEEPDVYTCDYIYQRRRAMTELQWENYTEFLVGQRIAYQGEIKEVYDDGRIKVDACNGIIRDDHLIVHGIPLDVALALSKGQVVSGEGTIREVQVMVFLSIHVDGEFIQ